MAVASLFLVERISTTLKSHGVPDESAYEVIAILPVKHAAEQFAHECRNLCRIRDVRVRRTHLTTYGMPTESARELVSIMPSHHD